ncbi:transcription termination factor mterf15 [Quercus suber]|uniref:Transcription termination factor mterf15 n=2 Tax=Quercus suber TaxID=58331 RepID=A0AAW0KVW4_QUESU
MMNEKEMHRRIEFLMVIGIPRNELDRVFRSFPSILRFGVEDRLKPLLSEFGGLGFSEDLIRKEIVREPRILGMELGELSRCLELLRTLNCREPIKEKIFIKGAFRAGFEVKLRVDCLCKHGLIRREAFKVLWKEPRFIIYEIEDIEKKIEFLMHRMKFNVGCLVDVPEYLGVNFEKQIVPRYNVIEYLRGKGGLGFKLQLKDLIKPSRLRFYNLYVKPYPECEKMFGRFSGSVEVKSQHPVGLWKLFQPQQHSDSKEDVINMKCFMESLG